MFKSFILCTEYLELRIGFFGCKPKSFIVRFHYKERNLNYDNCYSKRGYLRSKQKV